MIETQTRNPPNPDGNYICKPSKRFKKKMEMKSGRMRAHTLDLEKIRQLASVGHSIERIAVLIGVSYEWLLLEKTKNFAIEEAFVVGAAELENALRSTQVRLAKSGHPGMLIWLGKQFLGQSDKQESKTETTVNVVLQRAMAELRDLDADTIVEMKRLIEAPKEA